MKTALPEAGRDRNVTRRLFAVAVALGLVLRIGLLVVLGTSHSPTSEFGIVGANLSHGQGFVYFASFPDQGVVAAADTGHGLAPADTTTASPVTSEGDPQPSAYMPPVYPAVAGVADAVTTSTSAEIRLLQLLNLALFVALAYALFALGRTLLGPEVGALVALGAAVYPPLVYMTSQVSAANLYLPVECAMLVAAILAVREPTNMRRAAIAGGLVGVVSLLRPEGIVFGVLVAVVLVVAARKAGITGGRVTKTAGVALLVAAVPVGAWLVRNTVTFGRPTFTITSQAGFVLWAGNHEGATGSGKSYSHGQVAVAKEKVLMAEAAALAPGQTYELRREALFRRAALSWIGAHPVDAAVGVAKKTVLLAVVDPDDRRSLNPAYLLAWAGLVVVAGAGLRRLRPRGVEWWLIGAYAALSFFVPVFLVVLPRYRLPVDMVLLLPAALFVSTLSLYRRARESLLVRNSASGGSVE